MQKVGKTESPQTQCLRAFNEKSLNLEWRLVTLRKQLDQMDQNNQNEKNQFVGLRMYSYSSKKEYSLTNSSNIGSVTLKYPCLSPSRIPFLIKRDL